MQQEFIFDVSEQNIQDIIQKSTSLPVLFYFWSARSPEHDDMIQILINLANQYQGQFILAKLDCDEQKMLASQFGLRAIPTVYLFVNGQPVDGFQGNQTREFIQEMLTKVLPNEDEMKLVKAKEYYAEANFESALPLLKQAWLSLTDHLGKQRSDIALLLAKTQIELKQLNDAKQTLSSVARQDHDSTYNGLVAEIELLEQAANSPELQQLETQLREDPNNMDLMIKLASQFMHVGRHEEALELLFTPLTHDLNAGDGKIKKTLLDLLAALGTSSQIATNYRRKLYTLLY